MELTLIKIKVTDIVFDLATKIALLTTIAKLMKLQLKNQPPPIVIEYILINGQVH